MPSYTKNFNLYKPNINDDIQVDTSLSENFEKIDNGMNSLDQQLAQKATKVDIENTVTFYVSPSGNDENDGQLSTPFQTIRKAIDVIKSVYSVIDGKIRIDLAEGTYTGGIYAENIPSKSRIEIVGKVDVNGIPLSIIDGNVDTTKTYGFSFNGRFLVQLKDVFLKNFSNGTNDTSRYGVFTQTFSDLLLTNVHIDNCGRGVFASSNSRLYVEGGHINNCAVGIENYANVVFYIGYRSAGTVIKNCTVAGVRAFHQTEGHIDYSTIEGNALGIDIKNSSRVHATQNTFTNNQVGLYCVTSSTWFNDVNTFTGNVKDVQYGTFSNELSDRDLLASLYRTVDAEKVTHTGNTDLTIVKSITLPRRALQKGNAIKVSVLGKFNLTGANTCAVTCYLGGTNIFGSTSKAGSVNNFNFDWTIIGKSDNKIIARRFGMDNDAVLTNRYFELSYTPDIVMTLSVRVQLSSAADSVEIDGFMVEHIYG